MYLPSIHHNNLDGHICTLTDFDRLSYNDLMIYSSAVQCGSGLSLDAPERSQFYVPSINLSL